MFQEFLEKAERYISLLKESIRHFIPVFVVFLFLTGGRFRSGLFFTFIFVLTDFLYRLRKYNNRNKYKSYITVTLYTLGALSKAKGRVTGDDIKYVQSLIEEYIDYFEQQRDRDRIIDTFRGIFNQGKNDWQRGGLSCVDNKIVEYLQSLKNNGTRRRHLNNACFEGLLYAAIMQDGTLQEGELSLLFRVSERMKISEETYNWKIRKVQRMYRARASYSWYEWLGRNNRRPNYDEWYHRTGQEEQYDSSRDFYRSKEDSSQRQREGRGERFYENGGEERQQGFADGEFFKSPNGTYYYRTPDGKYYRVSEEEYQRYQQQHRQEQNKGQGCSSKNFSLKDAYDILGVKETDNFDTVKLAYRRLIKQYHPDKFTSRHVLEQVREEAKRKSQQIITAYDYICKSKGWK